MTRKSIMKRSGSQRADQAGWSSRGSWCLAGAICVALEASRLERCARSALRHLASGILFERNRR
jgi:hypothetical protein